jgi:ribonuclease P protein component
MRLTLGKTRRLSSATEFRKVREHGRSRAGRYLVLGVLRVQEPSPGATQRQEAEPRHPPTRAGFITTRKLGNAVTRNRLRRVLRDIVRRNLPRVEPGYWLVTIARNRAPQASSAALEKEWLFLAGKLGILKVSRQ